MHPIACNATSLTSTRSHAPRPSILFSAIPSASLKPAQAAYPPTDLIPRPPSVERGAPALEARRRASTLHRGSEVDLKIGSRSSIVTTRKSEREALKAEQEVPTEPPLGPIRAVVDREGFFIARGDPGLYLVSYEDAERSSPPPSGSSLSQEAAHQGGVAGPRVRAASSPDRDPPNEALALQLELEAPGPDLPASGRESRPGPQRRPLKADTKEEGGATQEARGLAGPDEEKSEREGVSVHWQRAASAEPGPASQLERPLADRNLKPRPGPPASASQMESHPESKWEQRRPFCVLLPTANLDPGP